MIFTAHIRAHSAVDRNWRGTNRLGGTLSGVIFRKVKNRFETDELTTEQVAALKDNASVEMVTMGTVALPAELGPVKTKKAKEPVVLPPVEPVPVVPPVVVADTPVPSTEPPVIADTPEPVVEPPASNAEPEAALDDALAKALTKPKATRKPKANAV